MQFEHEGSKYFLEFQRKNKTIKLNRQGNKVTYMSTYPYTTARLLKETGGVKEVMTEHTVGCLPTDIFSNEAGRLHALQGVTKLIPNKDLRAAMWTAYHARLKESVADRIKSLEAKIARLKLVQKAGKQ